MKKAFSFIAIVLFAIVALISFGTATTASRSELIYKYLNENTKSATGVKYMTPGNATTTMTFQTAGSDQLDMNIKMGASTTAAYLSWRYEFSDNNTDWYSEGVELTPTATTSQFTLSKTMTLQFASTTAGSALSSTTTSSTLFTHTQIKDISSNYTRIVFFVPIGSNPVDLWINGNIKQQLF
jgi:hypothetical protein